MWLEIVKTNNNPHVIGKLFLDCIKEQRGCPAVLRTDRGTEKGILASAQCFLRRHHADGRRSVNAHRYGSPHTNQRIEAWWAMLRRSWSSWWITFFKDLVATGVLDTSGTLHLECLWFCFVKVMKKALNAIKEFWNTHYVRSRGIIPLIGFLINFSFYPNLLVPRIIRKDVIKLIWMKLNVISIQKMKTNPIQSTKSILNTVPPC